MRLDRQVSELFQLTRSQATLHIKNGEIYVDGVQTTKSSLNVSHAHVIDLNVKIEERNEVKLNILYEDEYLAVIQKNAGDVMHGAPGHHHDSSLAYAIERYFGNDLSDVNGPLERGLVHRLDKDTSGIFVIARNNDVHRALQEQITNNQMIRRYIACVASCVSQATQWNDWIARAGRQKMKVVTGNMTSRASQGDKVDSNRVDVKAKSNDVSTKVEFSKYATTLVNPIWVAKQFSVIECIIKTGIQHQIRAQCAYHGHPIINDQIYGSKNKLQLLEGYQVELGVYIERQFLHAYQLELIHPVTNKEMKFEQFPEWYGFWNQG